MKKFTFLIALFILITEHTVVAQKVVVIGMNHAVIDGFSFVATETIPVGEIIYFTDNEYSDAVNAFTFNGQPTGEAVVKFTVTTALLMGDVVFVDEISANTFTVTGSGGSGTAVISTFPNNGGFSLATNGDNIYAYSDTDENPVNGITQIYSVLYTGSGELPPQNGGSIPADANPVGDFPNAIVVDGFADDGDINVGPDRVEYKFNPASLRDGVSKTAFENPANYLSYVANQVLSIVPFTNLNLSGANPVLTVTASPASVSENSGSVITYTFSLSANATSNITGNFSVGGTATFTSDYTQSGAATFSASAGTVTIASGTKTAAITISPVGDFNLEPDETVILTLTSGIGYDAGSPGAATGKIINDDKSTITPLVAVTGINEDDPEGFSFVALDNIAGGTIVFFTENSFDNTALAFTGSEGVLQWIAPPGGIQRGEVIVVKENPVNTFSTTSNSGNSGTVALISGTLSLASTGEEFYAYKDADNNPLNGVSEVYSVLFTGTTITPGGNIPAIEDPSLVYIGAVVVDGFAATLPNRTEYDPAKRGVTVDKANFQNPTNWLHSQTNQDLSVVPFSNIIISAGSANPAATVSVSPTSVLEDSGTGLVYTFALSAPASGNITVNFSVAGTATFNTDYTVSGASSYNATTGSVTILNGTSSSAVTIMPTVDSDVEVQEIVTLTISSGTGYDGGSPNDATGSIINDDTSLSDPLVAITGLNHATSDGFSFVAAKDIPANTKIYFTENSFNNTTLMFGSGESVLSWTSPGSVVPAGQVIVVTETGTDVFALTRSSGSLDVGNISVVTGGFAFATDGETFYAYKDNDNDPTNGVEDIYVVLFTGAAGSPGGTIPATEDPSGIYLSALVVDGFPAVQPNRTEYDPAKRNVLVEAVDFEDTSNWLHAQANQALSTVPFDDIQIIDLIPPVAVCKDITVDLLGTSVNIAGVDVDNGSSDNIGIASYSLDISTFTCADVGAPVTVILTVTDAAGNSDNCTATVTVLDKKAPSPICINGLSFSLDATGSFTLVPGDLLASPVSDNCSTVTLSLSKSDYTCADLGTNIVQLHATDENGNSDYCETAIIIKDVTPPTAVCQNIDVYLDGSGNASIVAADLDGGSTDNCSSVSLSASATTFTCADLGPNNVTLTVTDQFTNSANCVAVVNVIDTVAPTAICKNITVNLNATGTASISAASIDGGSTDNCGAVTLSASATTFTCADLGANSITLTVTDQSTNTANCIAVVTVMDLLPPTITCPGNQIENADANCEFTLPDYTGLAVAADNCNVTQIKQLPVAGTVISGTTTITLTADDGSGNAAWCSFDVSLVDVTPPTVVCKDISVYVDGAGNASIVAADIDGGTTDNCSPVTLSASQTAFTCADLGPNNVTLTATDGNALSASCTAVVTVIDTIPPTILCKDVTIYLDAAGEAPYSDFINAGAIVSRSDNCGLTGLGISGPRTYTCDQLGDNTVSLYQNDVSNNQSICTFTLTVLDNIPPVAICKDITVNLDDNGAATITGADIDNGSKDNCTLGSLVASQTSFNCADIGDVPVTLTVSDLSGKSATCTSTVTVADNVPPSAICKDVTVYLDAAGTATITTADIDGGSKDNCSAVTISASQTAFSCADVGPNTVTLTVNDMNGSSFTCSSNVTVADTISPVAICKDITVNLDGTGNATIAAADIDNGSTDNCALGILTASQTSFSCADIGSTTVTLTVPDVNGNSSTCSSVVTVIDAFPPVAVCKDAYVYLDGSGNARIKATDIDGGSNDNCALLSMTAGQTDFSCEDLGIANVTLTVEDEHNNVSSCTANVYVSDLIFPVAKCKDIIVSVNRGEVTTITTADIDDGSTDNCGVALLKLSKTDFTVADMGSNKVTLTAFDETGYFSTCEAVVTVGDYSAPDIKCNPIDIILDESGSYKLTSNDILNLSAGTSDNIDDYNDLLVTASPDSLGCINIGGGTIIELTATDKAGNSSTCSTLVNVFDTTTLVVNPVEDVNVELAQGVCETQITYPVISSPNSCALVSLVSGLGAEGVFPVGITTETWMATNTKGDTVEVSFNVIVTSVNSLPTLDSIADITINEGTGTAEVKLTGISQGMDCESQNVKISATGTDITLITDILVEYASPDSTGMLHLTIAPDMVGVDTITVTVSDGESSVSEKFAITIVHINHAPVVINPIDDQNVIASHVLKIPVSSETYPVFEDLDGDTLNYSFFVDGESELLAWMTVENDSLVLSPAIADTGCVVVVVVATDPYKAMAADTFQLCVDGYPTGSRDLDAAAFDVKMFPNPTKGEVYLKINSSEMMDSKVIVRSITGAEVFRKEYKSTDLIKIDLSEHVSGIYLITLQTGDKSVVKKLIIDRK